MALVVNLFGGPGSGKSTTAAAVFSLLKLHGINAELITEFAKDLTWEGRQSALSNQYYVWAKQHHRLQRVVDQVDVVVVDSPLLLSLIYNKECVASFYNTVIDTFNEFNNVNFFLERVKVFNPIGRNQNEVEAKEIDKAILNKLNELNIKFSTLPGDFNGINHIVYRVLIKFNMGSEHIVFIDEWK